MTLYIKRVRSGIDAFAEFNPSTKECVVKAGSIVSEKIAHSEKFRGAKSIEKSRQNTVKDRKVICDVTFKSLSTAANFVTGASTNGYVAWKNSAGKKAKELMEDK